MFSRSKFSAKLDQALATGKGCKLKENVVALFERPDTCGILYYSTIIVRFDSEGATVDLGGWDTRSTRDIICATLRRFGMEVWHKGGQTYFTNGVDTIEVPVDGAVSLPYSRGVA